MSSDHEHCACQAGLGAALCEGLRREQPQRGGGLVFAMCLLQPRGGFPEDDTGRALPCE